MLSYCFRVFDGRRRRRSPVVCVAVSAARCGVDIVSDQPVEVLVAADADALHLFLGDVGTIRIEVA